ncbi:3-hydroxyacyl-CoA dehydrogenase [Streptomyces sp. NRRL F-5126]|uniref:3-hydroxyacyl-CoA dehydrogenase n=1 Tax=Streptomyces sp. NRRL F-5126 TaxID=1463857 RepID=UPI0004C6084F|nr:3-hydroxyacyl-CoA dehydrogenase [Streptomyces sp. NRRL F-5126]
MAAVAHRRPVSVVGTGTMGQGIAQVALVAGHPVRLYDAAPGRSGEAVSAVTARLDRMVEKGRLERAERDAAVERLTAVDDLAGLAGSALVVEAVLEDAAVKRQLFADLEKVVADDCLLATNTSSLAVTEIAGALRMPGRFVGLHFFNPAPLLPLVEVVSGYATDPAAADLAYDTARAWGKTPVRCSDTPGFIVNRIARPFYAEAFRLHEERAAGAATIDAVLRGSGGFRMGPFELTDLIGQDVNEAVTRSVWDAFFHDPKFTPSLAQHRLVQAGRLGRKSGHGWFPYGDGAAAPEPGTRAPCEAPREVVVHGDLGPAAALAGMLREAGVEVHAGRGDGVGEIEVPGGARLFLAGTGPRDGSAAGAVRFDLALDYGSCTRVALAPAGGNGESGLRAAVGLFQLLGKEVSVIADVPGMVVARTVAMLIDLALDAEARGVASLQDIDTAMRLGVNYPAGPGEWCTRVGAGWALGVLRELHEEHPGGRYAPSRALRVRAGDTEDGS